MKRQSKLHLPHLITFDRKSEIRPWYFEKAVQIEDPLTSGIQN